VKSEKPLSLILSGISKKCRWIRHAFLHGMPQTQKVTKHRYIHVWKPRQNVEYNTRHLICRHVHYIKFWQNYRPTNNAHFTLYRFIQIFNFQPLFCKKSVQKAFSFRGALPPTPTRGLCSWIPLGALPQIHIIGHAPRTRSGVLVWAIQSDNVNNP